MFIGNILLYKGKLVYITGGSYKINGRISNCWSFKYVNKDGSLGESGSDYDNELGKFEKPKKNYVVTIVKED